MDNDNRASSPPPLVFRGENPRPLSASSVSSTEGGSTSSATSSNSVLGRTSRRKTWRMSIQEQDDEKELLSVEDAITKCKTLQGEVRELQANLLDINTENTRLQNDNLRLQQTETQSNEDHKKLQAEHQTTVSLLEMTRKENEELKQARKEADIEYIKMQNSLLDAQTESGKAIRELDLARKSSIDHSECAVAEERLLGTIASLKKELNLLRQEKVDLTDRVEELEKQLEQVPQVVEKSDEYALSEMKIAQLQEKVNAFDGNMSDWFVRIRKMQSLFPSDLDSRTSSPSPSEDGDSKASKLNHLIDTLYEKLQEETEYSQNLATFTKELVSKLGKAMQEEVPSDRTYDVEEATEIAIQIVEKACAKIESSKGESAFDSREMDALHRSIDRWIASVSSALTECANRCYLTTSNRFPPTSFTDKVSYLSDIASSLPSRVESCFDRLEEDQRRTSEKLKERLNKQKEKHQEIEETINKVASDLEISSDSSDTICIFKEVVKTLKDLQVAHQVSLTSRPPPPPIQSQQNEVISEEQQSDEGFEKIYLQLLAELKETDQIVEKKEGLMRKAAQYQIEFITNSDPEGQSNEMPTLLNAMKETAASIGEKKQSCLFLIQRMQEMYKNKSGMKADNEDTELKKLLQKLQEMEAELERKTSIIDEFKSTARLQQSDQDELKQKLSEYANEASLEKERILMETTEVRRELEQKSQIISTLEAEISELKEITESQKQDVSVLKSQITATEEKVKQAEEELSQNADEKVYLKIEVDRLKEVIGQQTQTIQLNDEFASVDLSDKEALKNEVAMLKQKMEMLAVAECHDEDSSKLEEYEKKIQALIDEQLQKSEESCSLIAQLRQEISEQQSTIDSQVHDIVTLRDETHHDVQCITELKGQLALLEEQLKQAPKEESDTACEEKLPETIESLSFEMDKLKTENVECQANMKKEISKLENTIANLKQELEDLLQVQGKISEDLQLKEELTQTVAQEKQSIIESERNNLKKAREENLTLRSELQTSVTLAVHNEETSALQKEISELKDCLQGTDLSAEVESLKQALSAKEEEFSATINTLKSEHEEQQIKMRDEVSFTVERLVKSELDAQHVKIEQSTVKVSTEEKNAQALAQEQQQSLTEVTLKLERIENENLSLKSTISYLKEEIEVKSKTTDVTVVLDDASVKQCKALLFEVEGLQGKITLKDLEIKSYSEQVHQHSITIVAIEERLNQVVQKNREYREEIENLREEVQQYKVTIEEYQRERIVTVVNAQPVQPRQTTVIHQPASNQGLVRLRRENANLKNQNEQAQKVIAGLRRDIAGLGARLGDVTSEIDEAKKKEIDDNRVKLSETGRELSDHKGKVKELFRVVDEKLAETRRLNSEVKRLKEAVLKLKKLVEKRDQQVKDLEDKLDKVRAELDKERTDHQEKGKLTAELAALGAACRGERHTEVIANQKSALNELRATLRTTEQWPRPAPTHEEALHQVMLLKKELAEMRVRECMSQTGIKTTVSQPETRTTIINTNSFEKSAHSVTLETLDLSENSFLGLLKSVSVALDVEDLDGLRRLAHLPHDEQLRLFREREQTCTIVSNRIELLRERLRRKEDLLSGYEQDLARLHRLEETCSLQDMQVKQLTGEIRERTEEGQCLRYSLDKARNKNGETGRHYITAVKERKPTKSKESAELMKKKNYEIKVLKSALERKDLQLDSIKRQIVEVNSVKKTPSPPVGRPSSAKVRRPRPTSAKRPLSAKVTRSTTSTTRTLPPRTLSPPHSARTPRDLLDENYQIISSTDEIRRSLEVNGKDVEAGQIGDFEIEETTVTVRSDNAPAEEVVSSSMMSNLSSALTSSLTSKMTSSFITEEVGSGSAAKGVTFSTQVEEGTESSDF